MTENKHIDKSINKTKAAASLILGNFKVKIKSWPKSWSKVEAFGGHTYLKKFPSDGEF